MLVQVVLADVEHQREERIHGRQEAVRNYLGSSVNRHLATSRQAGRKLKTPASRHACQHLFATCCMS